MPFAILFIIRLPMLRPALSYVQRINTFSFICLILLFSFNTANAQNFSTHQVKKGETIEAIAERYFVTPSEIYALNPDSKKELKPKYFFR